MWGSSGRSLFLSITVEDSSSLSKKDGCDPNSLLPCPWFYSFEPLLLNHWSVTMVSSEWEGGIPLWTIFLSCPQIAEVIWCALTLETPELVLHLFLLLQVGGWTPKITSKWNRGMGEKCSSRCDDLIGAGGQGEVGIKRHMLPSAFLVPMTVLCTE